MKKIQYQMKENWQNNYKIDSKNFIIEIVFIIVLNENKIHEKHTNKQN